VLSVISSTSRRGSRPVSASALATVSVKTWVEELRGADVDGNLVHRVGVDPGPLHQLLACCGEHPGTQRMDQGSALGGGAQQPRQGPASARTDGGGQHSLPGSGPVERSGTSTITNELQFNHGWTRKRQLP